MVNQSFTNDGGFAKSGNAIGNRKVQKPKAPITVQPVKPPSYTQASKSTGPYIPGISDNPAALRSASGSNVTTNKTAFPATTSQGLPGYYNSNGGVVEATKNLANTKIVSNGRNGEVVLTNAGKKALQSNQDLLNAPAGSGGGEYSTTESNTSAATPSSTIKPELMSGAELAKLLGTVYDRGEIEKAMTDAVAKQYANLDTEYGRTQDSFYDAVGGNANMLLDTLKRGDRQAAISGASAGTQAATSLSALLGISKDNAQGATELAQGRSDLVTKREADMAAAKNNALKTYNDLSTTLGERISSIHNANMVGYTGELGADASRYGTDGAERSSNYAADKAYAGTQLMSNAQVAAAKYSGSSNTPPVDPNAQRNQDIANLHNILVNPNLDKTTRAAYQKRLNELTGVTIPVNNNSDLVNGGSGYNPRSTIDTFKMGIAPTNKNQSTIPTSRNPNR